MGNIIEIQFKKQQQEKPVTKESLIDGLYEILNDSECIEAVSYTVDLVAKRLGCEDHDLLRTIIAVKNEEAK